MSALRSTVSKPASGWSGRAATTRSASCSLGGKATVEAGPEIFRSIGARDNPFAGKPTAVYIPWRTAWAVIAETALELAVCSAPGGGDFKIRLIGPDDVKASTRGKDTNTRHVADILPETRAGAVALGRRGDHAFGLLVVLPAATSTTPTTCRTNRSSRRPTTTASTRPQGFGFQRVYTDDRALDETMTIEDGDVVMVPKGYHPCGTAHGYDLYYLNVMAGPKRVWKFNTEECHRWLLG